MTEFLVSHEAPIRLGFFFGVLAVMAAWGLLAPRRAPTVSKALRWTSNLGIVVLNTVVLRLVFPVVAVGMAALAAQRGWGLLNAMELPFALAVVIAVVALDLAIYLQHVLFHAVPALWRLHRMHHADLDFDVTTGAVIVEAPTVVAVTAPRRQVPFSIDAITFQPGDTLFSLSRRWSCSVEDIVSLNGLPDERMIGVGLRLQIPR